MTPCSQRDYWIRLLNIKPADIEDRIGGLGFVIDVVSLMPQPLQNSGYVFDAMPMNRFKIFVTNRTAELEVLGNPSHGQARRLKPFGFHGVFVGDDSDLKTLIAAGEDPDATTLAPGEAVRSAAVRSQFMEAHGIDDAGGWHVHHIKPVGVGGPDAVDNMVLIDPAKHAEITAAHADYYGWPKFSE